MRILVLSGSPKGMLSATLHYVFYLQKKFPEHEFPIVHLCLEAEKLEQDPDALRELLHAVREADGVLWSYPIYTFLVHSHVKRFIELVNRQGLQEAFRGKFTALLSTSIHFFDHTAHNYMRGIGEDWGMNVVDVFSATVYDLVQKPEQRRLEQFALRFFDALTRRPPAARVFLPVRPHGHVYRPGPPAERIALDGRRAVILMDSAGESANLVKMVERLQGVLDGDVQVIDLSALGVRAGCDGCFQCGADGKCVLRNADDVNALYLERLTPADVVVMAGTVIDRYLSWRWKLFFDRGFFRPLVPWWPGKQMAFLVAGPLRQLPNLRSILEGYAEFHQGNLVGIVTDEAGDSAETDRLLDDLAFQLADCAERGYVRPRTFLGVGSTRIFRDDTWGFLRPVFQVAHRYYRDHGMYDFPQNSLRTRLLATFGTFFTRLPGVRKEFFRSVKKGLLRPLEKVLEKM